MGATDVSLSLTAKERATLEQLAKRDEVTVQELAGRLFSESLARRVWRNTGKTPAKVYSVRGR